MGEKNSSYVLSNSTVGAVVGTPELTHVPTKPLLTSVQALQGRQITRRSWVITGWLSPITCR